MGNSTPIHPDHWTWNRPVPRELIARAVAKIEVAMGHGNREEAIEAVSEAFADAGLEPITAQSSVYRLDIGDRVAGILDMQKVQLVGHLLEMSEDDLLHLRSIGPDSVKRIRLALKKLGMHLRQPLPAHGVAKWEAWRDAG